VELQARNCSVRSPRPSSARERPSKPWGCGSSEPPPTSAAQIAPTARRAQMSRHSAIQRKTGWVAFFRGKLGRMTKQILDVMTIPPHESGPRRAPRHASQGLAVPRWPATTYESPNVGSSGGPGGKCTRHYDTPVWSEALSLLAATLPASPSRWLGALARTRQVIGELRADSRRGQRRQFRSRTVVLLGQH
jgi:hypothetical protein